MQALARFMLASFSSAGFYFASLPFASFYLALRLHACVLQALVLLLQAFAVASFGASFAFLQALRWDPSWEHRFWGFACFSRKKNICFP